MLSARTRRKPPPHLKAKGADFWRNLVAEFSITDTAGLALVETAAVCVDRLEAAQAAIAEHGEIILDRYGSPKVNPATALEKEARAGLLAALKALGLDLEPVKPIGRPSEGN